MGWFENTIQNPLFLGGANLMMGGGPDGMMQGLRMGSAFQEQAKQRQEQEAQKAALANVLGGMSNVSDADRAYLSASPESAGDFLKTIYANRFDPMADIKRKTAEASLRQTELENSNFPLKQRLLQAQIAEAGARVDQGRNGKYGLQPVYGTDANGNAVIMQLGPSGEAVATKMPDGVTLNLEAKSAGTAIGRERGMDIGKAKASLPGAELNARKLTSLIDDVLNDKYLPNMTGPISGRLPNLSAAANRIQSKLDQIQGKTFLQAYESLKGSGQITEIEGAKAEASLQRLQNARVGSQDYIAALNEFRQDVQDLVGIVRGKASGQYYQPAQGGGNAASGSNSNGWSMRRLD